MIKISTHFIARRFSLFCLLGFTLLAIQARAQTPAQSQAPAWLPVGPVNASAIPSNAVDNITLVMDSTGVPYLGYTDRNNGNKACLVRFNGSSWVSVGISGFSPGAATGISLVFQGNTPYMSFSDGNSGGKASVMKFDGTQWVFAGNPGFTTGTATNTSLALTVGVPGIPGGIPVISFSDGVNGGSATVMEFTGGSWVTVGTPGVSPGNTVKTSVSTRQSFIYVLSFTAGTTPGTYIPDLRAFDGNSWSSTGGLSTLAINSLNTSFGTDDGGVSTLGYSDAGNQNKASVLTAYTFNHTNQALNPPDSVPLGNIFALAISSTTSNSNITPFEAFSDPASNGKATVRMYNGTSWVTVGAPGFSSSPVTGISIALNGNNPYVACSSPGGVFVNYYVPLPADQASAIQFLHTTDTTTHVTWIGGDEGTSTSVYIHTGTNGSPLPVNGTFYKANSVFAAGDQIGSSGWYCVYNALENTGLNITGLAPGTSYSVMAVTSNSSGSQSEYLTTNNTGNLGSFRTTGPVPKGIQDWLPVGLNNINFQFQKRGIASTNLVFDSSGVPYIGYADPGNGKAVLVKYDGKNWVTVGIAGFSPGKVQDMSLALTGSTPCIAFTDLANDYKATVMKFDGNAWVAVGLPGFTTGRAYSTSLAFNGTTPYLSFADDANNDQTTVMRFDGTSWITVGSPGFSSQSADATSLFFNGSTPYVLSLINDSNGDSTSVMKYDGTNWVAVGDPGLSVNHASLAFNGNTPYMAASNVNTNQDLFRKSTQHDGIISVLKYNGTVWVPVGTAGSIGSGDFPVLGFNGNKPYVAFTDFTDNYYASVKMYTDSGWVSVGSPGFSGAPANNISLVFRGIDPYVAYSTQNGIFIKYFPTTPTLQATSLHFTNIKQVTTTASWTNGNGISRSVFIAAGAKGNPSPVSGTIYTADAAFAKGSQIGSSGWYCIYSGTDTTVTITGLTADSTYSVMTVEANSSDSSGIFYLTSTGTGNPGSFTTTGPIISTTGTLTALSTTYGIPSASSSFTVSGAFMLSGIEVSAPAGFEVSTDNASFSPTVTAGTAGAIASTPVFIRLKSSDVPGSYSGDIVLSSQEATSVEVATVTSTVLAPDQNLITATNILTPNGDGRNDTWVVKDILLFPSNTVTVFDRFNHIVYSASGYTNTWGGTYHGAVLNEDTYYYLVDLGPGNRKFRGFITLLRDRF